MPKLRHRCDECNHRRGPRAVTATSKRSGQVQQQPRQHKKPCHCGCHQVGQ